VSCGIKAAAWSPDLDLLVIITGTGKLSAIEHICCVNVLSQMPKLL